MCQRLKTENYFLLCFLFIVGIVLFYTCFHAESVYDSGDGITHYLISKYSWKHPELLIHLWGKPFFTLLSSPFSQFGLLGIRVFQVFCALATSYFTFRVAKKLDLKFAWLLPLFICFSPIYFAVINSGLTEIFFGCVFMFSVWMIFENKFILAALAASFLPFVRSEAYVILPLIALLFLFRKKWICLPLLLFAPIVYSIAGTSYYNDFFWIINQSQSLTDEGYTGGKGEFLHYINHYEEITGTILYYLISIGLIAVLYKLFIYLKNRADNSRSFFVLEESVLIFGSFLAVLFLHSFLFWYKGFSYTNLGMMRYMAVLIPSASLIALRGMNAILFPLKNHLVASVLIAASAAVLIMKAPFQQNYFPFRLGAEEKVVDTAGRWFLHSDFKNNMLYYSQQFLITLADKDPFDKKEAEELIYVDKNNFTSNIKDSAVVIWDAHYSPAEGRLPLDSLRGNPHFELLREFVPAHEFTVLGDHKFIICVFQKHNFLPAGNSNPTAPPDALCVDWNGFEAGEKSQQPEMLSAEKYYSGKQSAKSTAATEFGPGIQKPLAEINQWESLKEIQMQLKLFASAQPKDLYGVMEIMGTDNKQLNWQSVKIQLQDTSMSRWASVSCGFFIDPVYLIKGNYLKLYVWNSGKNNFYTDDMKISFLKNDPKKIIVW